MKKIFLCIVVLAAFTKGIAQPIEGPEDTTWKKIYRGSYPKTNELVHTKLEVKFDF